MDFSFIVYIATFFSAISAAPQAIKTIKTRDVSGLSLTMWILSLSASISWFSYGIYLSYIPLVATNVLTTTFQVIILFIVLQERRKISQ